VTSTKVGEETMCVLGIQSVEVIRWIRQVLEGVAGSKVGREGQV
jgi:hypothetical protein